MSQVLISMDCGASQSATACMSMGRGALPSSGKVRTPLKSVSAFARNLGVSRQTLHSVLAERSGVSAEMALRLGTLLRNGAQLWLDMQTKFDLWQAETKLQDDLGQMRPRELQAMT